MNLKFSDLIVKWHKGIRKGSQKAFADKLGVLGNSVSQWIHGKAVPEETIRPKIAELLHINLEDVNNLFIFPVVEHNLTGMKVKRLILTLDGDRITELKIQAEEE